MADGRHGYNVSVGYTANFFPEMAPDWLDFCIHAQGFESQRTGPSYRYLDLGCAKGFHVCLLAAANPRAEFVGIDFDPDVKHGETLAAAAGLTNVSFIQADFLDLAMNWPAGLGTFDYITLQGILSWVSPVVRDAVFKCVAQASKPGTVATFGYNCWPGWLSYIPFQHLANQLSHDRDSNAAIGNALAVFRRLRDSQAQFFERMPRFRTDLDVLATQPPAYLAHEFLPDHWTPLWHSEVAQQLRADMSFCGSANIAEALLPNSLPPELAAIIMEQADDSLRQDVQDITIVQRFRRDIFCRDPRPAEPAAAAADTPIYLASAPQEGASVHFRTTFGGLAVEYGVVADIVAALAEGPKPFRTLMALENSARLNTRSILISMLDAGMIAVGNSHAGSVEIASRFNAAVAAAVAGGESYLHLAAAALGSGVPAGEMDLLLLDTWLSAGRDIGAEELAEGVANRLRALGRQLRFRGGTIADDKLQSHIAGMAPIFFDQMIPTWRRLGVVQ